jgi:hypothetical protein
MSMKRRPVSRICAAGCISILLLTLAFAAQAGQRVIVVGDVHGGYAEFTAILQRVGLIDASLEWQGGAATLVQIGDVMDRGAQVRACLDLLIKLKQQAGKARGKVIPLMGNHETMNLMHDLRYVTPAIYKTFSTNASEEVRAKAYRDYGKFLSDHSGHSHAAVAAEDEAAQRKWMDAHPPGFFEYCDAFGPGGKYGRWVRQNRVIVQMDDGIFVHGGLNPLLPFRNLAELDAQVHADLEACDSLWKSLADQRIIWRYMTLDEAMQQVAEEFAWMRARGRPEDADAVTQMYRFLALANCLTISTDGPLWYRGLAESPEEKLASDLEAMLARLKARYIVSGHTVQSKADITPRFESRVFLIDTGMLKEAFGGRASALEIQEGRFTAWYTDSEPKILTAPAARRADRPVAQQPAGKVERR